MADTNPILEPLPTHLTMPGANPNILAREYLDIIADAITNQPRTLQKRVGPSEIGTPCARKLGYKLLGHPEHVRQPNWKATIGTGAHMWLETAFDRDNIHHAERTGTGQERWYIETRVSVGEIDGVEITGSCDLYDRVTATIIDHKTVGPTQLKKYRSNGPGDQYRIQAQLYGRGWQRAGLPVETVAVAFLPRNGELADTYIWHEPYDEQTATNALKRAEGVALATKIIGHQALTQLEPVDDYCTHCPFFKKGSTDLASGCPGAEGAVPQPAPALTITPDTPQKEK